MDWSLLHSLNDFMAAHDGFEDPLLFYVEASEALFAATLVVLFLLAHGARHAVWRRATLARGVCPRYGAVDPDRLTRPGQEVVAAFNARSNDPSLRFENDLLGCRLRPS
jgi:hypothetical protein